MNLCVNVDLLKDVCRKDITLVKMSSEVAYHLLYGLGKKGNVHHIAEVAEIADEGLARFPVDKNVVQGDRGVNNRFAHCHSVQILIGSDNPRRLL